ncbi:MAG: ubiquinone/menaquinone biosynthesis methyltransferase [Zetaproteobacteria bacterium]|nr:ubiquinone/menaquinone biosynthesis methyltransferase [Zetaproteobacteria bacterium]
MPHTRSGSIRPESEEQVLAIFDKIAFRYDLLNRLLSLGLDQRWRRLLVSWLPQPLELHGTLVDIATGTGDVIFAAHKYRKDYAQFIGLDLSENMLQMARKKAGFTGWRGCTVEWLVGSAEHLPFEEGLADVVTIAFGLRNVIDKQKALAEFVRIVRPGGSVIILELMPSETSVLSTLFLKYFERILPKIGSLMSSRDAYEYLPKSVSGFYNFDQLHELALGQGLMFKRRRCFAFGTCQLMEFVKR